MAFGIKKLPFPAHLANVPCAITIYEDGVSEDGGPIVAAEIETKCIFSEHARRVIDADGKVITLEGKAIIKGDIAPDAVSISNGVFVVFGRTYEIHAGHRPRNPDGSVHHSELEIR